MDDAIPPITTPRLSLRTMSPALLRLCRTGKLREAAELAGFAIAAPCSLIDQSWVEERISMIEQDPSQQPWLNRAIVRRSDNLMVGHISFHHKAPDPHLLEYAALAAELGYAIEAPYRRCGYAIESACALMEWARREHEVATFILSISPSNEPSLRLAQAMGFHKIGEHLDEVDGLEWVMRAGIDTIREAMRKRRILLD